MLLLFLAATQHVMSGKPFFVLGLCLLVYGQLNRVYQARLVKERAISGRGNESATTKRLGRVVTGVAVLGGAVLLGILGWMGLHN